MLPLQIPGGMEIAVFMILFALPVLFVVFVVLLIRMVIMNGAGSDERLDELEERVDSLEASVEEMDGREGENS